MRHQRMLANPQPPAGTTCQFVRNLLLYLLSDVADLTLFFTVGGFLAMLVLLFR